VIALVRHAQTDSNKAGLLLGRADPPLNDAGREQARGIAGRLANDARPIVVVSSPLRRAMETAEQIATMCDAPLEPEPRLIELDYGEWDERGVAEVSVEEWRRWRDDPEFAPPGGESLAQVQRRVAECMEELFPRAADGSLVAVSHVSPIKAAVAWALGVGPEVSWRLRLDVASITRVVPGPDRAPVLLTYNETKFLLGHSAPL
jgi:broad specificity phosphatase PhoE